MHHQSDNILPMGCSFNLNASAPQDPDPEAQKSLGILRRTGRPIGGAPSRIHVQIYHHFWLSLTTSNVAPSAYWQQNPLLPTTTFGVLLLAGLDT